MAGIRPRPVRRWRPRTGSATTTGLSQEPPELVVRQAEADDAPTIASLRSSWRPGAEDAAGFARRIAAWLAAEGERRTTWLAEVSDAPVGMASLVEYRRMPSSGTPDSVWGYIGNMFVRGDVRSRGIGSALLSVVVAAADDRGYERLVLSPSTRAIPFFMRAGFVVPGDADGADRLLVRSSPTAERPHRDGD